MSKTGVVLTSMISVRPLARESPEEIELGAILAVGIAGSVLSRQRSSSSQSQRPASDRGLRRRGPERRVERVRVLGQDGRLVTDMARFLDSNQTFPDERPSCLGSDFADIRLAGW
jgi:hypothetical protein